MPNPSPAFQFYPGDYLSDDNVEMMTLEEQGAYVRLLCHAWRREPTGCLPNDPSLLGSLSRLGAAWPEHAATITRAFEISRDGKMLRQKRLIREWEKQQQRHDQASAAGKKGMATRWRHNDPITPLSSRYNEAITDGITKHNHSVSSSVSSSSSTDFSPITPTLGGCGGGNGSTTHEKTERVEPFEAPAVVPVSGEGARLVADFDRFWAAYPRRRAEMICRSYWLVELRPAPDLVERMLRAVEAQRASEEWRRDGGRAVPNPERWLREERWRDDAAVDVPVIESPF